MHQSRRDLLATGAVLATTGLAGCSGLTGGESGDDAETSRDPPSSGTTSSSRAGGAGGATADAAVAAEWNAMRARLWDAVGLGRAGAAGAGAGVAGDVFARFEEATGEHGAHETLEATDESTYEEFEEALGELRTAGLAAGDVGRAREEAAIADAHLAEAQRALVGETTAALLDLQALGVTVGNAAFLAASGHFDAAATTAETALRRFEESPAHEALEEAEGDAYGRFEGAVEAVVTAAGNEDAEAVGTEADAAVTAAIDGSYAVADAEAAAGAGHIATLQARGWDAAALASMGGPSTDVAHAAALTVYRARAYDARWLAARGETDRAATMAGDVFAHFEGARVHEALEAADGEAYEGFEAGLSDLQTAIEDGNASETDGAVAAVDSNLVTGIEALAGANAPLLESAFFRARFADAHELYLLGHADAAASIARGLFERFEANELDFHETVESTSEELYARFEEEHLGGLIDAYSNGEDSAVETHHEGVQSTLLSFETAAGTTATVSGAEGGYLAARGFDAAVLDALGDDGRAGAISQAAFQHFESGAGGYHEALEAADEAVYGAFEEQLGAVGSAASNGDDVYPVAKSYNAEVLESIYAIVGSAGGSHADAAATVLQDVFARFEESRVHGTLEEADREAYETFEGTLDAYVTALEGGGDVHAAATAFADAALYAQFAVAGAVGEAPLDLPLGSGGGGGGSGGGGDEDLLGGPNVVEGVPDDADHVVQMNAVSFEPTEITVSAGDTVAWKHTAGEAHTVTADGERLPDGASYWASGGFDSEEAARSGFENGKGAVQSGHSFVHTFETTGKHAYLCVPHEAAGMTGSVIVE